MLKKLQIKFVCITMAIITVMLCVIFFLIINSTMKSLREECLYAMEQIEFSPEHGVHDGNGPPPKPDDDSDDKGPPPKHDDDSDDKGPPPKHDDDSDDKGPPPKHEEDSDGIDSLSKSGDGSDDHKKHYDMDIRLPYLILYTSDDGMLTATGSSTFDLADPAFLTELSEALADQDEETGILYQHHLRFMRKQTRDLDYVILADTTTELATILDLCRNCSLIFIVAFVLFFLMSLGLSRWAISPVAQAWDRQKQFVANASHELKTPLTVIITSAELLNEGCPEEQRSRFTGNILTMSRQMKGLVEGMLDLARMDHGITAAQFTQLDISALAEECLLPFEPVYYERGLTLQTDIRPDLRIHGHEDSVRQLMEILLDNAQKYCSDGGTVRFRLTRQKCSCVLTVSNPGPAMSKEELKEIFRRFHRVDISRGSAGSYGLGLSIAIGIVESHSGKIWAESENGINTFTVHLPLR